MLNYIIIHMNCKKYPVRARFANESVYMTIQVDPSKLNIIREFATDVFATIDDVCIEINREDYDAMIELYNDGNEKHIKH